MEILILIFLALFISLILSFMNFDRLIKREYTNYKDQWIKDGKPNGFFWKAPDSTWIRSGLSTQRLSISWLFKTPFWMQGDLNAKTNLRTMRICVLIWNVGLLIWFGFFIKTMTN